MAHGCVVTIQMEADLFVVAVLGVKFSSPRLQSMAVAIPKAGAFIVADQANHADEEDVAVGRRQ